jgi:hypothetical protein
MGSGLSYHRISIASLPPRGQQPLTTIKEALAVSDALRSWPSELLAMVQGYASQSMYIIVYVLHSFSFCFYHSYLTYYHFSS